jgi:hypothetical protein
LFYSVVYLGWPCLAALRQALPAESRGPQDHERAQHTDPDEDGEAEFGAARIEWIFGIEGIESSIAL